MTGRADLADERGASLLLALAFVAFIGVFCVAVLGVTGVGSNHTAITTGRLDQLWGADAGMEYGLAALAADPEACASAGSLTWPATVSNGGPVTYGCTWLSGGSALVGSPLLGEYGTIVTGAGIDVDSANADDLVLRFAGSVHTAGAVSLGTPAEQTLPVDGNVTTGSTCPLAGVVPASPGTCTGGRPLPAVPIVDVHVPTSTAPAPTVSGSCTTLYPGRYGEGGRTLPTFSSTGQYYLASGVYYVRNRTVALRGTVFGGARGAGEVKALDVSPCRSTNPTGTGYSGSGVSFVLSGSSTLTVASNTSRVELYARVPGGLDSGATPGVGIHSLAYGTTQVSITNAPDVVVHGLTYVPLSYVQTTVLDNAAAGGSSVFAGGLVTLGLGINPVNSDDRRTMTVAGIGGFTTGERVVRLTATATGATGAAPTTITATVRPEGTPRISEWRVG